MFYSNVSNPKFRTPFNFFDVIFNYFCSFIQCLHLSIFLKGIFSIGCKIKTYETLQFRDFFFLPRSVYSVHNFTFVNISSFLKEILYRSRQAGSFIIEMASPRYCIPLGPPIDSLVRRGLAKCAASEPRKLFPFSFFFCRANRSTPREAAALFFSTFLRKLLSASVRRKELPLESRRCVVRHASRAYITVVAVQVRAILLVAAARRSILIPQNRTTESADRTKSAVSIGTFTSNYYSFY